MTRSLVVATCALTLSFGCGGKADRHDAAHAGSAGQASSVAGSGHGGSAAAGAGAGAGGGRAGGGGSSGAARGGTTSAGAGSGGSASGAAGRGNAGRSAAGSGGTSGSAGTSTGGGGGNDTGAAGAAGEDGARCGGLAGATCPTFEYCDYDGDCTVPDARGVCRSASTQSCGGERVCGCDGKVYAMACRAYSAGVDITSSGLCVAGNGEQGDACVVDDDCSGDLKCCGSPVGVVSCTEPAGAGCPLTP